jgi:predicted enzyme related to lactoylglutathione lyase
VLLVVAMDNTINYVEIPSTDLAESKRFFNQVFGWQFQDFGPEYTAIQAAGCIANFINPTKLYQHKWVVCWWCCIART